MPKSQYLPDFIFWRCQLEYCLLRYPYPARVLIVCPFILHSLIQNGKRLDCRRFPVILVHIKPEVAVQMVQGFRRVVNHDSVTLDTLSTWEQCTMDNCLFRWQFWLIALASSVLQMLGLLKFYQHSWFIFTTSLSYSVLQQNSFWLCWLAKTIKGYENLCNNKETIRDIISRIKLSQ